VLVDHPMPVGVRPYDVPLSYCPTNQIWIALGDPSEEIAEGLDRFALEQVEHSVRVGLNALFPIGPAIARSD